MENGDSNSQSAGFELLRRSCAGRCQRPWSPPCRARQEATGRSTFQASGGTGLLLNASLQRAWTNGLLTERRRCSLTWRSERQAELEISGPLLKSARGGGCTRGDRTGCAQSRGVGQMPRTRGPHTARFPVALSSPRPFLGAVEPGCSLGRAESRRGLGDSHPNPQGRLGSGEQAPRADLRSAPVRRARPDLLPDGPGGPGARGVLLTRRRLRDRAGGRR